MHFDSALPVGEQVSARAASSDIEAQMRRKASSGDFSTATFRKAYDGLRTLEARHALVAETARGLLPENWRRALQLILEDSRSKPDEDLLAEILRAGGEDAFKMAAESTALSKYTLGDIVREIDFPDKDRIVAQLVDESDIEPTELAYLINQSYNGEDPEISLKRTVARFADRFGAIQFWTLIGGFSHYASDSSAIPTHLTGKVSASDVLAALKPLAKNAFLESIVSEHERKLGGGSDETTGDHSAIVGVSEIRRHLSIEVDARIHSDGAEAALDWALTTLSPEFQPDVTRQVLWNRLGHNGLRPVLLALRNNPQNPNPELLRQAIEISDNALTRTDARKGGIPDLETFDEIQRLAGDNPDVAEILERYRKAAGEEP
jgi:hypothetical protein